ncbi:MAG: hypothetical protein WCR67_00610 [Bacilli bacterium]
MNVNKIDYQSCATCKKGKRFLVMLVDFFSVVIFAFSFFAMIIQPVFLSLSSTQDLMLKYGKAEEEVREIIVDSHLQNFNSDTGYMISLDVTAKEYANTMMLTSFYQNGTDYYVKSDDGRRVLTPITIEQTFLYQEEDKYVNDSLSYYYLNFRNDNLSDYASSVSSMSRKDLNQLLVADGYDTLSPSEFDQESKVFALSDENAQKMMEYINFSDTAGSTVYNQVIAFYQTEINKAIDEMEEFYSPYLEQMAIFTTFYASFAARYNVCLIISYLLGFLVVFLVFPLCFKGHRTIGYRFFGLLPLRNDQGFVPFWQILVKDLIIFIEFFSTIFFSALFLGKIQVLSAPLLGFIIPLQLIVFSFLLTLLSIVFFFVSRDNQNLSEYASQTYTIDIHVHIGEKVYGRKLD